MDTKSGPLPSFASTFGGMTLIETETEIQERNDVDEVAKHDIWYFNLRYHYHPWELKQVVFDDVVEAVQKTFPEDPDLIVTPLKYSRWGLYRVALNEPVPDKEYTVIINKIGGDVKAKLYVHKPIQRLTRGNNKNYNPQSANETRPGMIVIFNDAYIQDAKKISGGAFDKAISKYGNIIRPTLYHTVGPTRQLDGHRYCIIEVNNIEEMPQFIKIRDEINSKDFMFSLWWPNKPKFCYRCGNLHASKCPEMEEIEAAIEERKKHEIKRTIYSDSTLRLSDKIGLLAEVITMSGGTIGEIGNAVRDDKQSNGLGAEKEEIIIVAGKNNLKQIEGTRDLAKAAYAIDKGIEKIVNKLDNNQQVNFVNVTPQAETITPHQSIVSDYMEMSLNKVSESNTQVKVTHVNGENIKIPRDILPKKEPWNYFEH